MTNRKVNIAKLKTFIESEFDTFVLDGGTGTREDLIKYSVYLAEQVMRAITMNRVDLADSFIASARVRAAALRVEISKHKSAQIWTFARSTIRILAGTIV